MISQQFLRQLLVTLVWKQREYVVALEDKLLPASAMSVDYHDPVLCVSFVVGNEWQEEPFHNDNSHVKILRLVVDLGQ
jgi:hypothetical protein